MFKIAPHALATLCFLLSTFHCVAQVDVFAGAELGYPLVATPNNTLINAGHISFGMRAGIAYHPETAIFFPSLNLSYGRARLPLQQAGNGVTELRYNYTHVMLDGNFIIHSPKHTWLLYGGIGCSYLAEKGFPPHTGQALSAVIDSTANISKVFPAMNIGFEYGKNIDAGKICYLAVGVNIQYTLLLTGQNTYYMSIAEPNSSKYNSQQGSLSGSLMSPAFYISLHYRLHKKKDSMYL